MKEKKLKELLAQLEMYKSKADSLSYYRGEYKKLWQMMWDEDDNERINALCDEMACTLKKLVPCLKATVAANDIMEEVLCRLEKETGEDMQ